MKKQQQSLEQGVADLRERLALLDVKHAAARTELEAAQAARQNFMLSGDLDDDAAAAKLQGRVDTALSTLASLDAARAEISARLAEAEGRVAAEEDRVSREKAAKDLARDVSAIEAQVAPCLDAMRRLAADLEKHGTLRFDAGAIARFLINAAGEAELAFAVCLPDLRGACAAIARGAEKIPRAEAAPAPIRAIAPPPETQRVFLLRHCRWTSGSNEKRLGQRYTIAELPLPAAARALDSGAALEVTDDRCRQLHNSWPRVPTRADECFNLDDASPASAEKPAPSAVAPVRHSAFEPLDRGAPFTVRVPREVAS